MKNFSKTWKSSSKPKKQRKYAIQAPLHIKGRMLKSHLTKDLKEKYNKRATRVIKGDKVKIMTGNFKGKIGLVEKVYVKTQKIEIAGIESTKRDGSKSKYPIHVSNLMIIELNLNDKRRKEKLSAKISETKKVSDKTENKK